MRSLLALLLCLSLSGQVRVISSSGGGGGSSTAPDRVTWGLCPGTDCAVTDNITAPFIVTATRTLTKCYVAAKTAPTGADIIIDINKNGSSVFTGTKLVLAAGQIFGTQATFNTTAFAENDLITIDIEQVGSTVTGRDLAVTCTLQ